MPGKLRERIRWVFIASHHVGRLYRWKHVDQFDRCELEEVAELPNTLIARDRGKPPAAAPRGVDFANADRDHDVMRNQFASEMMKWFERVAREHSIGEVEVFADPALLGAIRAARSSTSRIRWAEHQADLAHLERTVLERHPAIRALIPTLAA